MINELAGLFTIGRSASRLIVPQGFNLLNIGSLGQGLILSPFPGTILCHCEELVWLWCKGVGAT
jgi:hypothetical protein